VTTKLPEETHIAHPHTPSPSAPAEKPELGGAHELREGEPSAEAGRQASSLAGHTEVEFEEEERQLVLLALAELALTRPGFDYALNLIARKLGGVAMYESFKQTSSYIMFPRSRP
jgi:hypothetical protein